MSFKYLAIVVALAAVQVSAQAASASDLAQVNAEWVNSGFPNKNLSGFGLTLNAEALLDVNYNGVGVIENGKDYTTTEVAKLPAVTFQPGASASSLGAGRAYTLMLADASALGDPDPQGNYRHYLSNSANATSNGDGTFTVAEGTVITSYAGPGPLPNSGTHRYAWMLFLQGSSFKAPSNLSTAGVSPSHWNVSSYASSTGLQLVAASFFTVTASGTPTGSVVTTAPVTSSTPATGTATSGASKTTTPGSANTSAPASGGSSGSSGSSGSEKLVATSLAGAVVSLAAFFALC